MYEKVTKGIRKTLICRNIKRLNIVSTSKVWSKNSRVSVKTTRLMFKRSISVGRLTCNLSFQLTLQLFEQLVDLVADVISLDHTEQQKKKGSPHCELKPRIWEKTDKQASLYSVDVPTLTLIGLVQGVATVVFLFLIGGRCVDKHQWCKKYSHSLVE